MNDPTKKKIERLGEYTPLGTKEMMHQMGMGNPVYDDLVELQQECVAVCAMKEFSKDFGKGYTAAVSDLEKIIKNRLKKEPSPSEVKGTTALPIDAVKMYMTAQPALNEKTIADIIDNNVMGEFGGANTGTDIAAKAIYQAIQPIVEENKELREKPIVAVYRKIMDGMHVTIESQEQQITDLKKQIEERDKEIAWRDTIIATSKA